MNGRKWMLVTAAAVVVAVLGGGAVMAQTGDDAAGTSFLDRVAAKLGVDRPTLDQAISDARDEEIDERLAAGDLTQEQADRLKEHLDDMPSDLPFGGTPGGGPLGRGPHGGGFDFGFEFRHGDGQGFSFKLDGTGFGPFAVQEKLSEFLGVDIDTLTEELQADGASLGNVAEAHGKTRDELRDFILTELRTAVDQAVTDGALTQDHADEMYDRIAGFVERLIDGNFGMPGFPGLFGDRHRDREQTPNQSGEVDPSLRS